MISKKNCLGITITETIACVAVACVFMAAIYSGMSLYERAKLNAVVEDFQKYDFAVKSFYQKYSYYPGDMPEATKLWPKTSNGDGNSRIGKDKITEPESYLAFQHLSLAEFVSYKYSGRGIRGTKIGVNTPRSPYRNLTTYWFYSDNLWGNYPDLIGLFFSGIESEGYSDHRVKVSDAYYIDKKIDDFRPYTGKIITMSTKNGDCVDTGLSLTNKIDDLKSVRYKFFSENDYCSVFMKIRSNSESNIIE